MRGQSMIVVVGLIGSAIVCLGGCLTPEPDVGRGTSTLPVVEDEGLQPEGEGEGGAGDDPDCPALPEWALSWNCNLDAEIEQDTTTERDECDYDPCGLTDVDSESWFNGAVQLEHTNLLATDGRRKAGTDVLRTGWRFCHCTGAQANEVADRDTCKVAQFDGTGLCVLGEDGLAEFDAGQPEYWQRMSLTEHFGGGAIGATTDVTYDGPAQRDGGLLGAFTFYPALDWKIRVNWDIDGDAQTWGYFNGAGYDMPGVLWTHTPGPTGEGDFEIGLRLLTSNHVSGWYGLTDGGPDPDTDTDLGIGPAPLPWRALCDSCPWSFPRPYLLIPDCLGLYGCTDPAELRFHTVVQDAAGVFTGGAEVGLGQVAGKWVAATEPDVYQGTTGIRYAAIAANGRDVNSTLTLSSAGLSRATPANNGTRPSSRSLFGSVVSVTKNRVWVMGGINGSGGLLQDLYTYNVATQTWSQVTIPGSYKPSRVLAATYSVAEDRLLVLDHVSSGGSVRLIRIDPNGVASSQLAGTWSRTASTTVFGLSAEPGHRGYVVACGGSSSHALLRLKRNSSSVVLWKTATGTGALASGQVQASVEGLSYLAQVSGVPRARGIYYREMSSGGSAGLCF